MFSKVEMKESVTEEVEHMLSRLVDISDWIGRHPELGSEEYKSSKLLADELEKNGFEVERGLLDMETAFHAIYRGKSGGPHIAFLAEYDALPGVGHACGHNIIGTAAIGAAIAVSKLKDLEGEVVVLGTPAEEGHGPSAHAKKRMVESGLFEDIDVAMMIHPTSGKTTVSDGFLAITGITIEFKGRSTHASNSPHQGVNALNAAVLMYMAVHANRQQLRRDANTVIHGIIKEGGLASNIIPDKAVLQFGVRSSDDDYIPELIKMVENSARGAALSTGCEVDVTVYPGLKSNIRNEPLEKLFVNIFKELGEEVEKPASTAAKPPGASTDFASVTHFVPGIHPMIAIAPEGVALHSQEFAEATFTDSGHRGLEIGAKALAATAVEILVDSKLLADIKEAHKNNVRERYL
jgi:amidohydrolase